METTNPLLCDIEAGMCEVPAQANIESPQVAQPENKIKITYFTDPICSSCWGIEPQLRKLKLEYGHAIEIEYLMGGLLPDWSYNSGGISKPADVAHHWDEVSHHYNMPIDGDVWLEDPLDSSFPPSIAFKAAQLQGKQLAVAFLRALRETVFLKKQNITKWPVIQQAAASVGLDTTLLQQAIDNKGKTLFEADLQLARGMGVRGFPTIFINGATGDTEKVYGVKPYAVYQQAINKAPSVVKAVYKMDWQSLFTYYATLTTREFAELGDLTIAAAETLLADLHQQGQLEKLTTKNGPLWIKA